MRKFVGASEFSDLRHRIAVNLDLAINKGVTPQSQAFVRRRAREFVERDLRLSVTKDGNGHYKYGEYSDESAHTALRKILVGEPAFQAGKEHKLAGDFEQALLNYLREQVEFSDVEIPPNIFRTSYRPDQKLPFATADYLKKDDDHAEYLCRRFLDKCSRSPRQDMGLMDSDHSGLIALIVLERFHADGQNHGAITFSDTFNCGFDDVGKISIGDNCYALRRIDPVGKPTISKQSVGHTIRERYTGHARKDVKFAESIDIFQKRVIRDFLNISVGKLFPRILDMNQILEEDFNSGSLFRVILDVEKGAVFAYQAAHGRFWIFAFCPVEQKVYSADDVLRQEIIEQYEEAVGS